MTETFAIQSDIALLPVVEERLFHFCHECHVGDCFSAVSVALLQAVSNAIVHGNGSDASKQVGITFTTCRGGIAIEVADEGRGFDFERYGELPVGIETPGEGIFVMKSLADRMEYSDQGRRVRMEFVVDGIAPTDTLERIAVLRSHFATVAA